MNKQYLGIMIMICLLASGCASVHNSMKPTEKISQWNPLSRTNKKKEPKKKAETPPENMAVIWKDNTYESENGLVVRGFEGRVYFHNANNEPIKATGDLIVYGFDDTDATADYKSRTPNKKFVITADELESNFVETHIGPSYRVWVPWEPVGGTRKAINLIPIFKMADGKMIRSGSSINILPGKSTSNNSQLATKDITTQQTGGNQVGLAGFTGNSSNNVNQAVMQDETYNQSTMRTTTIPLVPTLSSRLAMPQAAALSQSAIAAESAGTDLQRGNGKEAQNGTSTQASTSESAATRALNAAIRNERQDRSASQNGVFGVPGALR